MGAVPSIITINIILEGLAKVLKEEKRNKSYQS